MTREESRHRLREAIERASAKTPPQAAPNPVTDTTEGTHLTTAKQIREQADAADARLKEGKAKLYRPDGSKLYSDAEHTERVQALDREWSQTLSALGGRADEERIKAETEVTERGDLTAVLTADELTNAGGRYVFISEEVQEMSRQDLLTRLSSVAGGTDRASMFAHARATRKRANREYEARIEAARKAGRSYAGRSEDLEEAAQRVEDALTGGERKRKIEDARKRAEEYFAAAVNIGARKHKANASRSRPGNVRRAG